MAQTPPSYHPLAGLLSLGCGLFLLLVATGALAAEPEAFQAPRWVLGLCGVVFAACGGALIGPRWPVVRVLSLSALLLALAGVAAWAALLAPAEGWTGGFPFVPPWVNVAVARGLAGFGSLLSLWMLVYGWRTGFRSRNF
ncbi:MAG: hypothetical protein AAGI91_14675 [Bacteroidota bacterium]